jgi:Co/Zn/Cd efflux system component
VTDLSGPDREGLAQDLARVNRLEWITLAYLASSITVLVIVMSGSQALKTEFIGDALSMIAPALVLIGGRISAREPTEDFPFGYERAVSAGYLGAALALLAVGIYLFGDAAAKLVSAEHPIIGGMRVFGQVVWIGWLAFPALLWSSVPAFFLGRAKEKLAGKIYDKVLLSDAETSAANWKSGSAAMLGILGVAGGFWWADATAALFVSLEIANSGWDEVERGRGHCRPAAAQARRRRTRSAPRDADALLPRAAMDRRCGYTRAGPRPGIRGRSDHRAPRGHRSCVAHRRALPGSLPAG